MAKKKKETKVKTPSAINVSMLTDLNSMVDEFTDIPRCCFPMSVREYAQDLQARFIQLRADMISAPDWDTHCVDDIIR